MINLSRLLRPCLVERKVKNLQYNLAKKADRESHKRPDFISVSHRGNSGERSKRRGAMSGGFAHGLQYTVKAAKISRYKAGLWPFRSSPAGRRSRVSVHFLFRWATEVVAIDTQRRKEKFFSLEKKKKGASCLPRLKKVKEWFPGKRPNTGQQQKNNNNGVMALKMGKALH